VQKSFEIEQIEAGVEKYNSQRLGSSDVARKFFSEFGSCNQNARSPAATKRVGRTTRASVEAERDRRRREGTSVTSRQIKERTDSCRS